MMSTSIKAETRTAFLDIKPLATLTFLFPLNFPYTTSGLLLFFLYNCYLVRVIEPTFSSDMAIAVGAVGILPSLAYLAMTFLCFVAILAGFIGDIYFISNKNCSYVSAIRIVVSAVCWFVLFQASLPTLEMYGTSEMRTFAQNAYYSFFPSPTEVYQPVIKTFKTIEI